MKPAFRPPPDYDPAPSALAGITVYAPRPAAPRDDGVVFRCPQCAATTGFDVREGALCCSFCGHREPAGQAHRGTAARGSEFTLEAIAAAAHGWGVDRRTLRCGQCASERSVEASAIATSCPFCGSVAVDVLPREDATELRPAFVLPLSVDPASLRDKVAGWLGKGWFYHPSGLSKLARVENFTGVYLPYWLFDADVAADWEAEIGTDYTVTVTENGSTHTETRTSWKWQRGHQDLALRGIRTPGTKKMSAVLLGRMDPLFDLAALREFDPSYLAGWQALGYDVALPEAWELGRAQLRAATQSACERSGGGDRVRNFSMTAQLSEETWKYALLPFYASAYAYEGEVYQILVNGQTGDVTGPKPVMWWRVYVAIALFFSPGVCSGLIGLPLLLVGGLGLAFLIVGGILLIFAVIGSALLYTEGVQREAR